METVLSAAYSLCPAEKPGDSTEGVTWTQYKQSHSVLQPKQTLAEIIHFPTGSL